jgi:hypothetical protein
MYLWAVLALIAVVATFPASMLQEPIVQDHTQGYRFDPLLHLPGTSPYFDAIGFGLEHTAPLGCKVTAASYMIRHGAIYANDDEYQEYIKPFLFKLEQQRDGWQGPLAFMSQWESPILEDHLEDLTPSGARDAFKVGGHLVKRYPDLAPTVRKIIADKKPRTFDTAIALSKAFPNHEDIEVVQFLHNTNGSLDTLTPHKSCAAFSKGKSSQYGVEALECLSKSCFDQRISRKYANIEFRAWNSADGHLCQQLCIKSIAETGAFHPV